MGEAKRPFIIAHRGACKYAPENTIPAIRKAVALGVDGIEIDVQLTRDKVPVIIHSNELTPHTTTYDFVHRTALRALRTIDVGSHFAPDFYQERIPTLEEALEVLRPSRLLINLELKSQPHWHAGLEDRVVRTVRAMGLAERTLLSSFSPLTMMKLRYLAPEIPRGLLLATNQAFLFLQAKFFGKFSKIAMLLPAAGSVTPGLMALAKRAGWQVVAWTVNDREAIQRLTALGVDGLITDDPVLVREVVGPAAAAPAE